MEFNQITIPCTRRKDDWFTIVPLGDIHEGNAGCDLASLQKEIDYIRDTPKTWWVGMGDYIEAINPSDSRFDIKQIARKYRQGSIDRICQEQIETICEMFYPIRDKCLGLLRGNHEETVRKNYHYDVLYDMWRHLNDIKVGIKGKSVTAKVNVDKYPNPKVKLLYDSAVIRVAFINKNEKSKHPWKVSFDIFVAHGHAAGRKPGGKVNRIEDLLNDHDVDIVMIGHGHTQLVIPRTLLGFNRYGKFTSKKRRGVMTGSFLKGYTLGSSSYVEKAGFPPTEIGTVKVKLNPITEDMKVIV